MLQGGDGCRSFSPRPQGNGLDAREAHEMAGPGNVIRIIRERLLYQCGQGHKQEPEER
jgi:hypothetical protein